MNPEQETVHSLYLQITFRKARSRGASNDTIPVKSLDYVINFIVTHLKVSNTVINISQIRLLDSSMTVLQTRGILPASFQM